MKKLLVAIFDSNAEAFESAVALRSLHRDGDITIFGSLVLEKDEQGNISIKQGKSSTGKGWALGLLAGSLVGSLGGSTGVVIGASVGGLTGLFTDFHRVGIDASFIDEVSDKLEPGLSMLIVDLDESWTMPVDLRIEENNGIVFRRNRDEVIDEQLQRESAAIKEELQELKAERSELNKEVKLSMQKRRQSLIKKSKSMQQIISTRLEDIQLETSKKTEALKAQLLTASEKSKSKIEQRLKKLQREEKQSKEKLVSSLEELVRES